MPEEASLDSSGASGSFGFSDLDFFALFFGLGDQCRMEISPIFKATVPPE